MSPREQWTDDRLDDLSKRVDNGFDRVDKKIDDSAARLDKKIDDSFAQLHADMREIQSDIKNLNRSLLAAAVAIIVALIAFL